MSLLQHFNLYHGDWMKKREELNELFESRPPFPFTVYPEDEIIYGQPFIIDSFVHEITTRIPSTNKVVPVIDYYLETFGYEIKFPETFAICFTFNPLFFYPAELLYLHELDSYETPLPNPFTIVL
ncbi:hypothetical protein GCK72_025138 [Caenorhabditis remanei]|uniref:PAZ domain-containing protein n=1 Tax=Caenorhabditis remanei TaxID=31234 RepID=A0A6A5G1N1_CAERE|nr:hypothetical protein GCK72_025138 [Caenorhabditis remanei]KAF1748671.1 hypothetical protein GCK72_025138 [Caenorhabditis remanei]